MKSILSLILPDNEDGSISKRFLKAGRKAIGFHDQQLVTANSAGTEQGFGCLTADDIQTSHTGAGPVTLTKRFIICSGYTAGAVVVNIPVPTGELRELIIQNANTVSGALTVTAATATIFSSASATVAANVTVAINTTARFLSNGTNWYRVS